MKYAESSSDISDDESLATIKRKLTKAPTERKTSARNKKTKPKLKGEQALSFRKKEFNPVHYR